MKGGRGGNRGTEDGREGGGERVVIEVLKMVGVMLNFL